MVIQVSVLCNMENYTILCRVKLKFLFFFYFIYYKQIQVIEFDDGSGSVLRIQPLRTPRDEAVYECHASNSAGEITATTRLNVLRGKCRVQVCCSIISIQY